MKPFRPIQALCALALLAASPASLCAQKDQADQAALDFFEKRVRPILANNCYNCHSANTNSRGGLRVDDRNGLIQGGSKGPAVVPGLPQKSLLIHAVRHSRADLKMPPEKHLAAEDIAVLEKWIHDGAAWPKVAVPDWVNKSSAKYERLRKEHWAWQPLRHSKPTGIKNAGWVESDIDRYILAVLEDKGLKPAPDADRVTLIRRVTFDLTGLPPTPEEVDAFVLDTSADAFAKVVDRLLASPAYGERWGRHWLDLARYGESTGSARNLPYPHAWRYRDYVIDAFAADKPYDQFVREQIAGDLLPATSQRQRDEQLIATGFLALGVRDVNQRFKVRFVMDNIDEQIDTVGRALLGLTISCARCHNHKFDPIPTTDYYALAGIFQSSDLCAGLRNKMGGGGLDYYDTALLLPLGSRASADAQHSEKVEHARVALKAARAEALKLSENVAKNPAGPEREKKLDAVRKRIAKIQSELVALEDPAMQGPVALGVRDAKIIGDAEIRIRGEAEQLGPTVPRGFLSVINVPSPPKVDSKHSGRLELAEWLTSPHNPLTSRVLVNRVWHHLFGQGLVTSVDNFGVTGATPSHPELLDHLAQRFVHEGWSIKKLVRTLVLTHAYRLGSEAAAANLEADPANRLVWRHSPRRQSAEEVRDAMLAASGTLDLTRPGGSAAQDLKVIELTNNSAEARRLQEAALASKHRSAYLPLVRLITPRTLEVFDFAEQGLVTGSRDTTTVATQALYLLNDPFVRQQSRLLAERLLRYKDLDDAGRIALAVRLTLTRQATTREIERSLVFITDYEAATGGANARTMAWASFCQALLASAEFRYVR